MKEEFRFFKKNPAPRKNVCLEKSFEVYRCGYKRAAEVLSKKILSLKPENNKNYQSMIFPLLYVYRHYFEITLKDLIRKCYLFNDFTAPETSFNHDLNDLWSKKLKPAVKKIEDSFEEHEETKEIAEAFKNFTSFDKNGEGFRFPLRKDGRQSLAGLNLLDLKHFCKTASKISFLLERLESEIHFYWHAVGETEMPDNKRKYNKVLKRIF
jgi:hypothetical protein